LTYKSTQVQPSENYPSLSATQISPSKSNKVPGEIGSPAAKIEITREFVALADLKQWLW